MIQRAVMTRLDRVATSGRTGPLLSACEPKGGGSEIEAFVKLSAGCDQGVTNLAREVIAACLAADLHLPVPTPLLVEIPIEMIEILPDDEIVKKIKASNKVAFGSTRSPNFTVWSPGQRLTAAMKETALNILLFDAIIQNPDRRSENPNCLVRGDQLRIIDHELAFAHRLVLFWKAPWTLGGLNDFETLGRHIFVKELKGASFDFGPIVSRWQTLSDQRISEYQQALPQEWDGIGADTSSALKLISDARDNISACVTELERILR